MRREHGIVAAEGEPAPPRAADPAAPGDRDPQAAAEEAAVDVRVDRGEVVDAAAGHEGRHLARRLAHAVQVRVHEAPHLAARGAAAPTDVAGERGHHRVGRVQEHAVQPQQQAARLALERQEHRAVVGEDEPQRLARLARERRLERRLLPAGRLLERELELPCGTHGKPVAMRMAQRRPSSSDRHPRDRQCARTRGICPFRGSVTREPAPTHVSAGPLSRAACRAARALAQALLRGT